VVTFGDLTTKSWSELEDVLRAGKGPNPQELMGWEYRGWNHLAPLTYPFGIAMGIRRFIKGFYKEGDAYRGYNKRVERGGRDDAWTPKNGKRREFFRIHPPKTQVESRHPGSALFDYRVPETRLIEGSQLRDFVVQVGDGDPSVLLGKAYLAFPGYWLPSSFFVLERIGRNDA
jgi:hypothetical protein